MKKTILITGCSSGIGYTMAKQLQEQGYQVIASARKQADVDRLNQENLPCVQLDVNDSNSIESGLEAALALTGGSLDVLINNAAFAQVGAIEDMTRDAIRAQFETNVFGVLELTNKVIPIMRKHGEGHIINISSILGLVAMPYRGAYNASKFALEGLTDTLRMELHDTGIHVSLIEPGPIQSQFRSNAAEAFKLHVDANESEHSAQYLQMAKHLQAEKPPTFSLPAEAVGRKVIKSIESRYPKAHYYVTVPTYVLTTLKRLLPSCCLDWVVRKVS